MNYYNIKKIAIFLVMIFILDYIVGQFLEFLYFNQKQGAVSEANYIIYTDTSDVIIYGSSGAKVGFIPSVIDSITGLTVYNAGRNGIDILYNYAILKMMIESHKPEYIILNLTPGALSSKVDHSRLYALLPYYRKNPNIRKIADLRSNSERIKNGSRIYPYNSMILNLIRNYFHNRNVNNPNKLRGFQPHYTALDTINVKEIVIPNIDFDIHRVTALDCFLRLCVENKIQPIVTFTPWYDVNISHDTTVQFVRSTAKKYKVPVYDFIKHPDFMRNFELFKDEQGHLNIYGAKLFSIEVGYLLNEYRKSDTNRLNLSDYN
jgi:hypothetical protein